jgi:DNA-binding CsgD family transcriptional regulator
MHLKPQTRTIESLSDSELVILRSIALGLDCDTIRDLLEISHETYTQRCESLFHKLGVCNAYAAVRKAFLCKILVNKEYSPEKVKTLALKYAHHFDEEILSKYSDTKGTIWELYDMMLEFYSEVENSFMRPQPENKKSHRSGI